MIPSNQKDAEWEDFRSKIGRLVIAAGNAESSMNIALVFTHSLLGKPEPDRAFMWDAVVKRLSLDTEELDNQNLRSALQPAASLGRKRNNIIHSGWYFVTDANAVGRRLLTKTGAGNKMLVILTRESLERYITQFEAFDYEISQVVAELNQGRLQGTAT